jgi:hypothetical protein
MGHLSAKASFMSDRRRFENHGSNLMPGRDREPILSPDYDCYTIWDDFQGTEPGAGADRYGVANLERLLGDGVIDEERLRRSTTRS